MTTEAQRQAAQNKLRQFAAQFADMPPSKVTQVPWIFATRKKGEYPPDSGNGGKWLLFVPVGQLDDVWRSIREATAEGRLGGSSKSATALRNPNAKDESAKVICVYTYDAGDEADVRRVRAELRTMGFEKKISYKANAATRAGKYQVTGAKRIASYYE